MLPEREPSLLGCLWQAWKAYANRAGGYQAQVLLSAVYYLVLGPSALLARLFRTRLLDLDPPDRPRDSYWIARAPLPTWLDALEGSQATGPHSISEDRMGALVRDRLGALERQF